MFQAIIEFGLMILVLLFLGTQVIVPMTMGGPYFPIFRYKKVEEELREAQAEILTAEIEKEVQKTKKDVEELRKTTKPKTTKPLHKKSTRRRIQ